MTANSALRQATLETIAALRIRYALWGIARKNPVLVFQMGKVGSSSITSALHGAINEPVYHVHVLSQNGIRDALEKHRRSTNAPLPHHLLLSRQLGARLHLMRRPVHVVTLTRNPFSRAISFLFQDWRKKLPEMDAKGNIDARIVGERFTEIMSRENGNADPTLWFNRELKGCFGVDVFSAPHDFANGYTILRSEQAHVLVIRMEDLDWAMWPALAAFLGSVNRGSPPPRSNVGDEKRYAESLARAKESLRLPPDVVESVMSTRYFEHYYSRERDAIRARWSSEATVS